MDKGRRGPPPSPVQLRHLGREGGGAVPPRVEGGWGRRSGAEQCGAVSVPLSLSPSLCSLTVNARNGSASPGAQRSAEARNGALGARRSAVSSAMQSARLRVLLPLLGCLLSAVSAAGAGLRGVLPRSVGALFLLDGFRRGVSPKAKFGQLWKRGR